MKMISKNTIIGISKLMNVKKPFYADEFGIDGTVMSALSAMSLVDWTGKTKTYFLHLYNDVYKKVEVKEWKFDKKHLKFITREIEEIRSALECWDELVKGK